MTQERLTVSAHLAVYDVEVLITEVFENLVDVLFLIQQCQCMQQVTPAVTMQCHCEGLKLTTL